jgi:hypothetical protein
MTHLQVLVKIFPQEAEEELKQNLFSDIWAQKKKNIVANI